MIHSGRGDDVVHGGSGNDRLLGGDGNDVIDGGTGNDRLSGDAGDDLLLGQAGNDALEGGAGNDVLDGGLGSDEIEAGSGNDTVIFAFSERGSSFDELAGGSGIDTLRLVFSETEWARADVRARVAALDAFIDASTGWSGQANSHTFESSLLGFSARQFERLEVVVLGENDAPVLQSDSATTLEDQPVVIAVLANDGDPDGDALTVTGATANHGSVVVNADGTLSYRGNANYNGSDVITYTVSDGTVTQTATVAVTITSVNDAPLPQNDSATLLEDDQVIIVVLANDSDPDGDALTVTGATANHGAVFINTDGRLAYAGDANYSGSDVITYTVSDGTLTRTATVAVTVTPVNDRPLPQEDIAATLEDQPVTIAVLANDSDPDGDTLTIVEAVAERGTVVINADGTLTYLGPENRHGTDFIRYVVSDGTVTRFSSVTIEIAAVNDAPILQDDTATVVEDWQVHIRVLENDVDPDLEPLTLIQATADHGTVTISAEGGLIYQGAADFNGSDVVTYTVTDGSVTRSATVAVTVVPENDAPSAIALSHATFDEDTPGAHVGFLSAVDPEGGVTFSVSDPRFEVVGNLLKLRDGVAIDRETLPGGTLWMIATATDDGGLRTRADLQLIVNDVDEGNAVSGFDAAGGEVFDIEAVLNGGLRNLSGWGGVTNPFSTGPGGGFFRMRQDGSDALLELDNNGGGDDFTPLVRFEDADIHDFTAATFFPGHGWQV